MKATKILVPVLALFFAVNACKKDEPANSAQAEGTTPLYVRLTDAPGNFEEVNVEIKAVMVNTHKGGWVSLNTNVGTYNLLNLTNGIDTLIGSAHVPSGKISEVRLILGSNNTVKVNGVVYPLSTPSAEQSGLKIKVNEILTDSSLTLLFDFDAAKSIHLTGNGTYKLKPVLRRIHKHIGGAIAGKVDPADTHPAIYAISGNDTISTFSSWNGYFFIPCLNAGTYNIVLMPAGPYQDTTLTNIVVKNGEVTKLGEVSFN